MERTKKKNISLFGESPGFSASLKFFFFLILAVIFFSKESKDLFPFSYNPERDKEVKRRQEGSRWHVWVREKRKDARAPDVRRSEVSRPSGNTVRQWQHLSTPSQTNTMFFFSSLLYSHSDCFSSVSGKDKTSSCTFETLLRSKVLRYATMDSNIFGG